MPTMFLRGIGAILVVVALVGCGDGSNEEAVAEKSPSPPVSPEEQKPETNPQQPSQQTQRSRTAKPSTAPQQVVKAPEFRLTAEELRKEFHTDKNAAFQKYRGKLIEVMGTVAKVGVSLSGVAYIRLSGDPEKRRDNLECKTLEQTPWAEALPGQQVVLRGTYPTINISQFLEDCEVVQVTGEPEVPKVTAEDYGKLAAMNERGPLEKYGSKPFLIKGTLKAIEGDNQRLVLGTADATYVILVVEDGQIVSHLKPGVEIEALGAVSPYHREDKIPLVDAALLVSPLDPLFLDPPRLVNGIPNFTTEELMTKYRASPSAFLIRYRKQPIQIRGKVANTVIKGNVEIQFEPAGKNKVIGHCHFSENQVGKTIQKGQDVTLQGELMVIGPGLVGKDEDIVLLSCTFISP
ncbi:MAG: hypothetical protein KDA84_09690 [Planctomycetaceae bacterium]|nr:hypothetical protein [Planctomycetaceae bacterium]